jgi:hypothetical protein
MLADFASSVNLRSQITCPHCWHVFPPDEVLWIATHSDLVGDPLLGGDEQQRFLPTRFDSSCKAVDVKGVQCKDLACPHCHLSISWALLEMRPMFVSILGAPGSGKSYYLAAMTWQLRQMLRNKFSLSFSDADSYANQVLSGYEERLFLNPNEDELVNLPKTELEGDLYQSVRFGDREVWYPKPFVFSVQPLESHPSRAKRDTASRALCLYDNAGEHFLPGGEKANCPAKHLALSEALLFLFDPTQHPKFRKRCLGKTNDPQMGKFGWTHPQHQVLLEAANRIRSHGGFAQNARCPQPLVVVLTKFDAWCSMLGRKRLANEDAIREVQGKALSALDIESIRDISKQVEGILAAEAHEVVSAADSVSDDVIYIPVSALGCSPEVVETDSADGKPGTALCVRPRDINPMWVEVPNLYALYRASKRLVREGARRNKLKIHAAGESNGEDVEPDQGPGGVASSDYWAPGERETGS